MEPPPYDEAGLHPHAAVNQVFNLSPPPPYEASLTAPPTPPPTYREAVAPPGPAAAARAVVVTQPRPVCVTVSSLTDSPGLVRCPHCRRVVTTKVRFQPGTAAWFSCIMLALMGCLCGVCLIPLVVRQLQDAHHSCPECGKHLLTYER